MAETEIPVDLRNPGQVFACLGFLEAADILLGHAEGGFDWEDGSPQAIFHLRAAGEENPVSAVLAFLASANIRSTTSAGWQAVKPKAEHDNIAPLLLPTAPSDAPGDLELPIQVSGAGDKIINLTSWCDASSRGDFKLYSGNRSAVGIAQAMLHGVREKPRKGQNIGDVKFSGLEQLWREDPAKLTIDPLGTLTAMGGSFNFDPRGAWNALDTGYSLNDHKHPVSASPVVEILTALGLEHSRPRQDQNGRNVRYAAWRGMLPPLAARPALAGCNAFADLRLFRFTLTTSGKNKIVTFAEEEPAA